MQFPTWTRNLLSRRRRRREKHAPHELLEPVRLSLRKLEERRVLDVSAALIDGVLEIQLSNTEDIATLSSSSSGDLSIADGEGNTIGIDGGSGQPGQVNKSEVDAVLVRGDNISNQRFSLETPFENLNDFRVLDSIESASINESIAVDNGGIALDSLAVELGADLEAGLDITFTGDVSLTNNVSLTGEAVFFAGTVNDDGDAGTGSSLILNTASVARFVGEVGTMNAIDSLQTGLSGHSEINADITASGNTITFNNPVVLTSDVILTDMGTTGIQFNDTVDSEAGGQHSLTAEAPSGRVTFSGNIGDGAAGDQSLGSLTVIRAAEGVIFGDKAGVSQIRTGGDIDIGTVAPIGGVGIRFDGRVANLLTITTNGGNVRWNGASELFTNVNVFTNGGNLTLTSSAPLNSQPNAVRKLTVDAGAGAVEFNADIGSGVPLNGLEITRADSGVALGATSPVSMVKSLAAITIGSGSNVIGGDGIVFDAGDGNTLLMTTTGDNVFVNGDVELRSHLAIDTGSNGGEISFSKDSEVDSQPAEANNLTLNAGNRIIIGADVGRAVPLGTLTATTAGEVAVGLVDGPVEVVRAHGGIDVTGDTILLTGAATSLTLETDGTDLRLDGATLLESTLTLATGNGSGDVILTNRTSVDSLGGPRSMTFDAGDGAILINENLGDSDPLAGLTVARAGGGVTFGEAVTESAGKGPVAVINTEGAIDLGVGTNVLGSIMFNGTATAGTTISTTNDDVRFNGPTQLGTKLTINTGSGAGDVTFTSDAPVDSKAGLVSDLVVNAGAGSLLFNEDLGAIDPLGHLTVVQADGGITLGAADTETTGSGAAGPVNLVRTARSIDLGVGTTVITGSGIRLNGGDNPLVIETAGFDIRANGAVSAQSDVRLVTGDGGGNIFLTSAATIDSSDGPGMGTSDERNDVAFDAGAGKVSINANLGSTQRLGSLTIERAADGLEIGGADNAIPGGKGPVSQVLTEGPIAFGSSNSIAGGIRLNAAGATLAIETTADNVSIDGPVEVQSNVAINTGTGGGDLNLSANSSLDSQAGEANDVKVTLDAGNATFEAAIGSTNPLAELRFTSANDITFQGSVNAARIAQDAGSGTTHFVDSISTTDATRIGVELTGTNFTFDGAVNTIGDGRVLVTHSGLLDINDPADMNLQGSFRESGGGTVETAASIVTTGAAITFGSPVTLTDGAAADVLLDTTNLANAAGADITFDSTLDGQGDGIEQLTLNAGVSGNIQSSGVIGGMMRVGPLHIVNANDVTVGGAVTATRISQAVGSGTTTFNGPIDTNDATERGIDLTTANVTLNQAVQTTGDGRVEITVSGLLEIADAADMNLSGSFLQDGGGSVRTSANITTSNDDITFTDAVVAADDLRFETGPGAGTVRFGNTLDGATDCEEDLHFATGSGDILFVGAVGASVGMGDLSIANADDVTFARSLRAKSITQTTGTGETRFNGPVTIKGAAGATLATANATLNAAFDTSTNNGPVVIDVQADIVINSSLTTGTGTVDLLADNDVSLSSVASVTTGGATINIVADDDTSADAGSGGAVTLSDGSILNAGNANIAIVADEDITLGRLVTSSLVTLTSRSGSIVDGGNSGGADIVADEVAFQATLGIGTANPIDTAVNTLAAKNEAGGGVRVENAAGVTLTIGDVATLSGVRGGPSTSPAKLGGDIEIIHVGAIDVEAPILNDAGGHTTLRAELAGDLTVNQAIQNRGGDGWILLFSGEDLFINHSLEEPLAEISVENEGAVRGIAQRDVVIENGETDYVIIRTHAERFGQAPTLTELSAEYSDPTHFPPLERMGEEIADPLQFYLDLEEELRTIREGVAPQATNFPNPAVDPRPENLDPAHETDPRFGISDHSTPFFTIAGVDQGGSDVNEQGHGIIEIRIGTTAHLELNWHLTVDWGDGTIESYTIPGNPRASLGFFGSEGSPSNLFPDGTITARLDSGVDGAVAVYYVHHTYLAPPDPTDPSAPTPVRAELRYDARAEGEEFLDLGLPSDGSSIFNGIRFFRNGSQELFATASDALTNPGAGVTFFITVVDSVIVPVDSRETTQILITNTTTTTSISRSAHFEFVVASFEGQVFEEFRLFMRVVDDVENRESDDEFDLPNYILDDPFRLFRERTFPNGHYRIYLEEVRTGRVRLILECHIYEGRVVPQNFRDSADESLPGSGEAGDSGGVPGAAEMQDENAPNPFRDDPQPPMPDDADEAGVPEASMLMPLAAVVLPWRHRVRQAIQENDRPLNRARMRLRKLRRHVAED